MIPIPERYYEFALLESRTRLSLWLVGLLESANQSAKRGLISISLIVKQTRSKPSDAGKCTASMSMTATLLFVFVTVLVNVNRFWCELSLKSVLILCLFFSFLLLQKHNLVRLENSLNYHRFTTKILHLMKIKTLKTPETLTEQFLAHNPSFQPVITLTNWHRLICYYFKKH